MLAGCGQEAATATATSAAEEATAITAETTVSATEQVAVIEGAVNIVLSDDGIMVDGEAISENAEDVVYAANDIVYYEEGKDFKYDKFKDVVGQTFEINGYKIIPIYHPSPVSPMSYKGNIEIFKSLNIKGSDKNE